MIPAAVSARTAAAMVEIDESAIREAIANESLRAVRIGGNERIRVSDLNAWLDSL